MPWNPFDREDLPVPDCAYIGGVLAAMEQNSGVRGLTFYVTSNLDELPSYGRNVVAIVLSDEWCCIPRYAFAVAAVFKTYGTRLAMNWGALRHPTAYELASLAQDLRTFLLSAPRLTAAAIAYARQIMRRKKPAWRVYDFPLGYFRQIALPFVAIEQRRFDVHFVGSVSNRHKASRPLYRFTPKFLSRENMLRRLRRISARYPHLKIETALTESFASITEDQATRYSQNMMQTKICLVPRGTSLETYRYFEGLRFGCVVVTERLPRRWFYDGSPALSVRTWSELDRLIPALIADPQRLAEMSRRTMAWWSERCSEAAVGAFMAERLRDRSLCPAPAADAAQFCTEVT